MSVDQPTRDQLLAICRKASVPQEKWYNRDSAAAQMQLGQAYALLNAGCDYSVRQERETYWVRIEYRGFDWFEGGFDPHDRDSYLDHEEFYLPTRERLESNSGSDWY